MCNVETIRTSYNLILIRFINIGGVYDRLIQFMMNDKKLIIKLLFYH